MRKGAPVLADGERHPSTRKRFGSLPGVNLVSICTRAGVGGSSLGFVARLIL